MNISRTGNIPPNFQATERNDSWTVGPKTFDNTNELLEQYSPSDGLEASYSYTREGSAQSASWGEISEGALMSVGDTLTAGMVLGIPVAMAIGAFSPGASIGEVLALSVLNGGLAGAVIGAIGGGLEAAAKGRNDVENLTKGTLEISERKDGSFLHFNIAGDRNLSHELGVLSS